MSSYKVGVIVIGPGRYALEAHLPVVADMCGRGVELTGLVDLPVSGVPGFSQQGYQEKLKELRVRARDARWPAGDAAEDARDSIWWPVDKKWAVVPPKWDAVAKCLDGRISQARSERPVDRIAVVVSTWSTAHRPYIEWALRRGHHVLADKPLTVPLNCAVDAAKAKEIVTDFEHLTRLATENEALFMLATQKRYSPVFTELANRIGATKINGVDARVPVTSVTYETDDGYWLFAKDEYPEWIGAYGKSMWGYRPDLSGGGKLSHTGYHIFDIIPWLIRHGRADDIDNAVVYSSFWRPADSFAALPLQRDKGGKITALTPCVPPRWVTEPELLSEVNAQVQIALRRGRFKMCQVMMNFLHEGISGPDKGGGTRRAKYEHMDLHQGPVAAAAFRRIAGIDRDNNDPRALGCEDHVELTFLRNTALAENGVAVEPIPVGRDEDTKPAEEFLGKVVHSEKPYTESASVVSPVCDHQIGVRLMEAAYRSAIAESAIGHPHPVVVTFGEGAWRTPPGASSADASPMP